MTDQKPLSSRDRAVAEARRLGNRIHTLERENFLHVAKIIELSTVQRDGQLEQWEEERLENATAIEAFINGYPVGTDGLADEIIELDNAKTALEAALREIANLYDGDSGELSHAPYGHGVRAGQNIAAKIARNLIGGGDE